jgi:predicted transposase/invertase (TIGR01784 family)
MMALSQAFLELEQQIQARGQQMGEERGRLEARQAIALKMLQDQFSIAQIAHLTGLTADQIEQLRSQV